MYKEKSFIAIIPARGGSKGIPHKNLYPVRNVPLIAYTLRAAIASRYIDRVIVTTDDDEIASVSLAEGADTIRRPPELANDTAKTIDAMIHVLQMLETQYDYSVLLQPTSPLRNSMHIDEAIEQFVNGDLLSLVSVSPVKDHPLLIRQMDTDGKLRSLLDQSSDMRRQDMPTYYRVNGAIYINRIGMLTSSIVLNDNVYGYVMPEVYGIDVDEPVDLAVFEVLLQFLEL